MVVNAKKLRTAALLMHFDASWVARILDGKDLLLSDEEKAAFENVDRRGFRADEERKARAAAAVVEDFDGFRSALTEAERTRRQGALTPRQAVLLEQFGYPYVAEEFKFHMTLTDRIEDLAERARFAGAVTDFFAFMADEPIVLDRLTLFREAAPGAPFMRLRDYMLTGEA